MDSHGRPVCADGHTRTATDVLCVLADTHGHPSTGRASMLSPRTNVLICVLRDSHGRPVCADGHRWTHTDSHGRPVCVGGHPRTHKQPWTSCVCWRTLMDVMCVLNRHPTWDKITQTVHGKGQRAESKDQPSVQSPRTNVLICVLMDNNERPVCADGHTRTPTDVPCVLNRQPTWDKITQTVHGKGQRTATDVLCVLTDTDGHTRTATDVLCVLADTQGRPVCTEQTAHGGQNYPNMLICVLMDSHRRHVCADRHTRTHTHSHERPVCVLMDTHIRPVCADGHPQTSCVY
ncbi:unnamed protein product [Brassica rapa]|uniref:Uncharacterized protein n=1 Tax=Brassica campestris TaxID=3711 RepID=A0A8D9G6L4_BRACM|nr:unnamed protein product [Brassica rapa]